MKILHKYSILMVLILSIACQSEYPYKCQPEDRDKFCTEEFIGVCGWYGEHINCIAYPCAETSGTICQACTNPDIEYVTFGECEYQKYPILTEADFYFDYQCVDADRQLTCDMIDMPNPRTVCACRPCGSTYCCEEVKVCDACSDKRVSLVMASCPEDQ